MSVFALRLWKARLAQPTSKKVIQRMVATKIPHHGSVCSVTSVTLMVRNRCLSDHNWIQGLKRAAYRQRSNLGEFRLETDKQRYELCAVLEERQDALAEKRLSMKERRLASDEKRLDIEAEERKCLVEEMKQVLGVLDALVEKLN